MRLQALKDFGNVGKSIATVRMSRTSCWRSAVRAREFAIRSALGASRAHTWCGSCSPKACFSHSRGDLLGLIVAQLGLRRMLTKFPRMWINHCAEIP